MLFLQMSVVSLALYTKINKIVQASQWVPSYASQGLVVLENIVVVTEEREAPPGRDWDHLDSSLWDFVRASLSYQKERLAFEVSNQVPEIKQYEYPPNWMQSWYTYFHSEAALTGFLWLYSTGEQWALVAESHYPGPRSNKKLLLQMSEKNYLVRNEHKYSRGFIEKQTTMFLQLESLLCIKYHSI